MAWFVAMTSEPTINAFCMSVMAPLIVAVLVWAKQAAIAALNSASLRIIRGLLYRHIYSRIAVPQRLAGF